MINEAQSKWQRIEEVIRQESYTPEELADLLGISVYRVRHSAREGELKAFMVDHHILDIRRADALEWLRARAR